MHGALAGIVAENSVDHDLLFVLAEPAVFAAEAALGLGRRCRHPKDGNDTNDACDETFVGEQISPASVAVVNVDKAVGQKCTYDGRGLVRCPKEAETDGQFPRFVKVREKENRVGNAEKKKKKKKKKKVSFGHYSDGLNNMPYNPPSRIPKRARQAK